VDRKRIAELAKNRIGKARQIQETPKRTGAQVLKVILDEEEQEKKEERIKPQLFLFLKDKLTGATNNWTKYPNEMHELIVDRLDPFEALLYLRLWRDSWGYNRNYCRHSHSKTMTCTCIKSMGTARRALEGLIKKRFIVRCLKQDDGKQDIDKDGSLYRILTPQEMLNGVTEEGILLDDIPDDGVISVIMISEIIDKNQGNKGNDITMITQINDQRDHDHSDHDQRDQGGMITQIMISEIIDQENEGKIRDPEDYDHIDHDHTDHPLKDIKDSLKDTLSLRAIYIFYKGIGQEKISKKKRERAENDIKELLEEGFSEEDICFAVKWTLENSKEKPYDFSLVKDTIGQAITAKEREKAKETKRLEIEQNKAKKMEEERKANEVQERIRTYKNKLSAEKRSELHSKALAEIRNTKGIKEEFITEILIEAKENELIAKLLDINLSETL